MLNARTFLAWKMGEQRDDCQDSVYPQPSDVQQTSRSYAVADGATTSFFSAVWASALTRHFSENPDLPFSDWNNWLLKVQAEWIAEVQKAAESPSASFFVINGLQAKRSAAAAFVGLTIYDCTSDGWPWRALVLGDSCLFRLSIDGTITSWRLKSSQDFSNVVEAAESRPSQTVYVPFLLGSRPNGSERAIVIGESLVLATDALAKWLLQRDESGQPVWGTINALASEHDFHAFISAARSLADNPLDNDDVALAVLNFGESSSVFMQQTFAHEQAAGNQHFAGSTETSSATGESVKECTGLLTIILTNRWGRLVSCMIIVLSCVQMATAWYQNRTNRRLRHRIERLAHENKLLRQPPNEVAEKKTGRHVLPATEFGNFSPEALKKENEALRLEIEALRQSPPELSLLDEQANAVVSQPPLRDEPPR